MPITFAASEHIESLVYYAELANITLRHNTTTYSFAKLTPIDGRFHKLG
jgi:hypothetical protein